MLIYLSHINIHVFLFLLEPDKIRVLFGPQQLEDDKTLEFYKITHSSTLILVMRMPGGGMAYD